MKYFIWNESLQRFFETSKKDIKSSIKDGCKYKDITVSKLGWVTQIFVCLEK